MSASCLWRRSVIWQKAIGIGYQLENNVEIAHLRRNLKISAAMTQRQWQKANVKLAKIMAYQYQSISHQWLKMSSTIIIQ